MNLTLVTGGAKNLGREICLTLAKNNYDIVVHYKNSSQNAQAVVNECLAFGVKATAVFGDFSTISGVNAFLVDNATHFGNLKNIVNNVGNYLVKPILETTSDEVNDLFCTNLLAPLLLIQKNLPALKASKGSIINIGVAGIDHGRAENYSTAYSMTKGSLLMLTRSLAKDLAQFDVAVNMVSPGVLENSVDAPNSLPMKRPGTYREVAEVILFLLNQNNHYITGQNIEVAGGLRL